MSDMPAQSGHFERVAHDLFVRAREDHDHRYAEREIAAALVAAEQQGSERGKRETAEYLYRVAQEARTAAAGGMARVQPHERLP